MLDLLPPATPDWRCVSCAFGNCAEVRRCDMCEQPRDDKRAAAPKRARTPLAEMPANARARVSPSKSPRRPSPPASPPLPMAAPAAATREAADDFERQDFEWSDELTRANHTVFGEGALRAEQLRAVNAALAGRDCLVVLPTGAGKSRCFQLPALLSAGVTVVVSPLLSLLLDQVAALERRGVRAAWLSSEQGREEAAETLACLAASPPTVKLLYLTPERLHQSVQLGRLLATLHARRQLSRFVVDEAHCVVTWGRDFRPDYLELGALRHRFAGVPCTLLTGTLPRDMRAELLRAMRLPAEAVLTVEAPLDRPNLQLSVRPKGGRAHAVATLLALLAADESAAVVYCHSQVEAERVCESLVEAGVSAAFFHAQVDPGLKHQLLRAWQAGEVRVMVATSAFGMGVHKDDVRLVVCWTLPDSLLSLYQERRGRDGKPARCVLLYAYHDKGRVEALLRRSSHDLPTRLRKLREVLLLCEETSRCRRSMLLEALSSVGPSPPPPPPALCCDACERSHLPPPPPLDVSLHAAAAIRAAVRLPRALSLASLAQLLAGSRERRVTANGHHLLPEHGAARALGRAALHAMLRLLVARGQLNEACTPSCHGGFRSSVSLGPNAGALWCEGWAERRGEGEEAGEGERSGGGGRGEEEGRGEAVATGGEEGAGAAAGGARRWSVFDDPLPQAMVLQMHEVARPRRRPRGGEQQDDASETSDALGRRGRESDHEEEADLPLDGGDEAGSPALASAASARCTPRGDATPARCVRAPPSSRASPPTLPHAGGAAAGSTLPRDARASPRFLSLSTPRRRASPHSLHTHALQSTAAPLVCTPTNSPLPPSRLANSCRASPWCATPRPTPPVAPPCESATPCSATPSSASTASGKRRDRQDPATVARVCELGRGGASVVEIDRTLHTEKFRTSTGTPWPARNDGRVVARILIQNDIPVLAGDTKIERYAVEYFQKMKADQGPSRAMFPPASISTARESD
ncbi:hypothetical protein AB1Y20_023470 [Prymnesium parvum]|uniref:DNA 3'-5' helicase n=1 Tax=Prymnesium parvum TaxID=97485 RepID=A0AB34JGC5_PRYPA